MAALRIQCRKAAGALAIVGVLLLFSLAAEAESEIRIALQGDIKGTNPGVTRDGNTDTVIHHIVESLVAYREDLSIAPHLAQRIEVSEDLTRYVFHLRRDVRFHNGSLMTSAEVLWSWRRMLDPATGWRCSHWYNGTSEQGIEIEEISAPDEHTVVFQLASPSSIFLDRVANVQCVTAILHPDSVADDGSWLAPVATGPYRLEEWKRGRYLLLRQFDGYSSRSEARNGYAGARLALVPKIRFMIIADAAVGVASILSGGIDIMPQLPLHLERDFATRRDIEIQGTHLLSWSVLLLQADDPLLRDFRIRRAIAHAINLQQVAAISTLGKAHANPSAVSIDSPYRSSDHDRWWPYDPQLAKALLREAGYTGEVLAIQTNRKIPFMFENAVAIQAMLAAVGINARLEVVDWATQLSDFYTGNFQLSSFSYSGRTHPALAYASFLGNKDKIRNLQWSNEAAQQLLQTAEAVSDPSVHSALYAKVHQIMRNEIPMIGLYNEYASDAYRTSIHGYRPWAMGRPRLWGVEKRPD